MRPCGSCAAGRPAPPLPNGDHVGGRGWHAGHPRAAVPRAGGSGPPRTRGCGRSAVSRGATSGASESGCGGGQRRPAPSRCVGPVGRGGACGRPGSRQRGRSLSGDGPRGRPRRCGQWPASPGGSGRLRARPNGYLVELAPAPPRWESAKAQGSRPKAQSEGTQDPLRPTTARLAASGISIGSHSAPLWDGTPFNVGVVIDALRGGEPLDRASPSWRPFKTSMPAQSAGH